jgi:hypothetical protein
METVERDHIVQILEDTRWKVSGKTGPQKSLGSTPALYAPACINSEFASRNQLIFSDFLQAVVCQFISPKNH